MHFINREDNRFCSPEWQELKRQTGTLHKAFSNGIADIHRNFVLQELTVAQQNEFFENLCLPYVTFLCDSYMLNKPGELIEEFENSCLRKNEKIIDVDWIAKFGHFISENGRLADLQETTKNSFSSSFKLSSLSRGLKIQLKSRILRILSTIINLIGRSTKKNCDVYVHESTFSIKNALKLKKYLSQNGVCAVVGAISKPSVHAAFAFNSAKKSSQISEFRRSNLGVDKVNIQLNLLAKLLTKLCPTNLLENFECNFQHVSRVKASPKIILATGQYYNEDQFFLWCQIRKQKGSKILDWQHGGHYGICAESSFEEIELKLCSKYISWGNWSKYRSASEKFTDINLPNFRLSDIKLRNFHSANGEKCFLYLLSIPKSSYARYSIVLSNEYSEYQLMVNQFLDIVSEGLNSRISLKYPPYALSETAWHKFEPNRKCFATTYESTSSVFELAKLIVHTYQSTGFIESFYANVPTLLLWKEDSEQTNSGFLHLKKKLIDLKMLFHSGEKLALFVNQLHENESGVSDWWYSNEVQTVRNELLNLLACPSTSPMVTLAGLLQEELQQC